MHWRDLNFPFVELAVGDCAPPIFLHHDHRVQLAAALVVRVEVRRLVVLSLLSQLRGTARVQAVGCNS